MMKQTMVAAWLAGALAAHAAGDPLPVVQLKPQHSYRAELENTVYADGVVVAVKDDPGHLRIGDGATPGGARISGEPTITTNLMPFFVTGCWNFYTNKTVTQGTNTVSYGPTVEIAASVAFSSTVTVRNAKLIRESTLTAASWKHETFSAPSSDPLPALPVTLTNDQQTVTTRTNLSGHIRLLIATTNTANRPNGTIDILEGTNLLETFYPACNGTTQTITYAYCAPSNTVTLRLSTLPDLLTNGPVTITSLSFQKLADSTMIGNQVETTGQKILVDAATDARQIANKQTVDDGDTATLAAANAETHARTAATDLQGNAFRWNNRFDTVTETNEWHLSYGGSHAVSLYGGGTVIPEIQGLVLETNGMGTLTAWASSSSRLVPEMSTNFTTWARCAASCIVTQGMLNDYTAYVTFSNAETRTAYYRVADTNPPDTVAVFKLAPAAWLSGGMRLGSDTNIASTWAGLLTLAGGLPAATTNGAEWGSHAGLLTKTEAAGLYAPLGESGLTAADSTNIAKAVLGAATTAAFSNVVFGATSTVMCATGTWYDAATRTAYTTSCPSGTSAGAAMTNSIDVATVSTNVSGTWAIDFRNGAAQRYTQVGAITSQTFAVDSTAKVATARVVLQTTTNAITWSTNLVRFVPNSIPIHATNANAVFYFEAHAGAVRAVYLGVDP